jgi:protein-tyrosine phosphatase
MGSEKVSQNKELLQSQGITHIINCSGSEMANCFPNSFSYMTLNIQDNPTEDISTYFIQVAQFVESALSQSGKVLVHCMKGVSRSAAVVISYLMYKGGLSFQDALLHVKRCRPVCEPNLGFSVCLLEWERTCRNFHAQMKNAKLIS